MSSHSVVVYSRESYNFSVVCCGGRMTCLETTAECEQMLQDLAEYVLSVQYDGTDFCRVSLLVNCVMWRSSF